MKYHTVRKKIFGGGANGDLIVVDVQTGGGQTGWLPISMVWGMEVAEVRNLFVPTNKTLGDFVRASEEEWSTVPKDWHEAKRHAAGTN